MTILATDDRETDNGAELCADALFGFRGNPGGVSVAADGSMWMSDTLSGTIWRITEDGAAAPIVPGQTGTALTPGLTTRVLTPAGLALSPDGSLFVADGAAHRVCVVDPDGVVRVLAGGRSGYQDGDANEARFRHPLDVALAPDGACYVADTGNDRIRRISSDGSVTTVAGSIYDYGDGQGPDARFREPVALDVDAGGACFVADTGNNAIRRISSDGVVTTLAGGPPGGDCDGIGEGVGLRWPTGVAAGPAGDAWVADHGNGALRHIGRRGESSTTFRLAGLRWPISVALGADGSPVVAGAAMYDVHVPEACLMVLGSVR